MIKLQILHYFNNKNGLGDVSISISWENIGHLLFFKENSQFTQLFQCSAEKKQDIKEMTIQELR